MFGRKNRRWCVASGKTFRSQPRNWREAAEVHTVRAERSVWRGHPGGNVWSRMRLRSPNSTTGATGFTGRPESLCRAPARGTVMPACRTRQYQAPCLPSYPPLSFPSLPLLSFSVRANVIAEFGAAQHGVTVIKFASQKSPPALLNRAPAMRPGS